MALSLGIAALLITTKSVNAHHGGAHILKVYRLVCWQQNDPYGADEPYLKLNNNRIWSGDCSPVASVYPAVNTTFWNQTDLRIMEDDIGPDDSVGYVLVGPQAGKGTQSYFSTKWVNGVGWFPNYTMEYEVR
jgi:hypothetical protein